MNNRENVLAQNNINLFIFQANEQDIEYFKNLNNGTVTEKTKKFFFARIRSLVIAKLSDDQAILNRTDNVKDISISYNPETNEIRARIKRTPFSVLSGKRYDKIAVPKQIFSSLFPVRSNRPESNQEDTIQSNNNLRI